MRLCGTGGQWAFEKAAQSASGACLLAANLGILATEQHCPAGNQLLVTQDTNVADSQSSQFLSSVRQATVLMCRKDLAASF